MLEKVIENWTSRLDYIRASRGSPMPEIIFKIIRSEHPPVSVVVWASGASSGVILVTRQRYKITRSISNNPHDTFIERLYEHGLLLARCEVSSGHGSKLGGVQSSTAA
ncbi:hypothetical protein TNCV_1173641 [Trichonephila clavipes]|uniref:Uncharacterized protein n=1 Tax=Trichonephila clavipes TaxID=2585209 RepID=A0A8X6RWZ4_TRICX|nr:hypothetical protein TNCV_1173641 [Trichonephila clavipes]